jgi:hypothetical protein
MPTAMNFDVDWVQLGVKLGAEAVFLTAALAVMLNQQKLPWKFPGLFASVLFACALIQIPYAGVAVSFLALLFCITKVIKARTFTDAIVAVGVAFAIFAVFNFLVLNFALGFLHHAVPVRARTTENKSIATTNAVAATNDALASVNDTTVSNSTLATPPVTTAETETPSTPSSNTIALTPVPQPTPVTPATLEVSNGPAAEPVFDTNQWNAARAAGDILKHYYVKGTSESPTVNLAMISNGHRNFDIAQGETVQLLTSDGQVANVKCETVGDGKVVLSVRGVKITIWQK